MFNQRLINGLLFIVLLSASFLVHSKETYGNLTVKSIVSVYDADTFRVNIEGYPDIIGSNMPIRAMGFDAPEIRGKCPEEKARAKEAKKLTQEAL